MSLLVIILSGLIVAIILSALYSGAETAAITVNEPRLRERAEQGQHQAIRTLQLLNDQRRVLAVVLVGTNLANVAAALLAERFVVTFSDTVGLMLPDAWMGIINFLLITPVLLLFGEIFPKHFCRIHANTILPYLVGFLRMSDLLLMPLLNFCTFVVGLMLRPLGLSMGQTAFRRRISLDDIKAVLDDPGEGGDIERNEQRMIARIFDLRDTIVREIMRPLIHIVSFKLSESNLDDVRRVARETGYSRFPVFEDRSFRMNGYIDIYDVIRKARPDSNVRDFVREPLFVPETMAISDLLTTFLKTRMPAAIVMDEHGGTVGWVTLEDVLEEVVGEIEDEFDPTRPQDIAVLDSRTLEVAAQYDIDDLNRIFELELPQDEDFDTIGGLVFTRLGRVGRLGDEVLEDHLRITVIGMEGMRITRLRLEVLDVPAGPPDDIHDDEDDPPPRRPPRDFLKYLEEMQSDSGASMRQDSERSTAPRRALRRPGQPAAPVAQAVEAVSQALPASSAPTAPVAVPVSAPSAPRTPAPSQAPAAGSPAPSAEGRPRAGNGGGKKGRGRGGQRHQGGKRR